MTTCFRKKGWRIVSMTGSVALLAASCAAGSVPAGAPAKFLGSIWQNRPADSQLAGYFDQVTPENCGKWRSVESERGVRVWTGVDAMVQYAGQHSMVAKHHCLVWGQQQPDWTQKATDMSNAVDAVIADFFTRFGSRVALVDVVNEPISAPAGYRAQLGGDGATGWDWVVWVFRCARRHASLHAFSGKLILNEWGIENDDNKMKRFREIVSILQRENLVDAIGVQGHFLENAKAADVRKRLDYLAETGLPIYISELDLDIADDALHQTQFASLFAMFWEHPAVRGVTLWGHNEGAMWRKNGYLIRKDGSERPAMTWLKQYLGNSRKRDSAPNAPADAARR